MSDTVARLTEALAGRYRIERELGAGGMATVYLAHDLKHDRQVAVKVLRPELAAVLGAERFLQEIRVTANLQHPHILPLHDSGEATGLVFYVMPFIEGESLREKLKRETELSLDEAVRIAQAVASALDYAHRRGIVHRDIKPENILLHDGQPTVADFGISLAVTQAGGSRLTETGLSFGTPQYMSPEQTMGDREVDSRSDVYSLGCVLYEMLAGEPPYTGPTAQAILAKVLTERPRRLGSLRDTVPAHVEGAVQRALAKLPADRFPSAAAFAEALARPDTSPTAWTPSGLTAGRGAVLPGSRRRVDVRIAALLALCSAAAGAAAVALWPRPEPESHASRFVIPLAPEARALEIGGAPLALSPDGTHLAYVAWSGPKLYLRSMDQLETREIAVADRASAAFFSPDSRWLAFLQDGVLKRVPVAGGAAVEIAALPRLRSASWGEGGVIVFQRRDGAGLFVIPADGGEPRQLTSPDVERSRHIRPSVLPGGKAVLFTIVGDGDDEPQIALADLGTGEVHTLIRGEAARYARGHLIYNQTDGSLVVQSFEPKRGVLTGAPVALPDRVEPRMFEVSESGLLVYLLRGREEKERLVFYDREGRISGELRPELGDYEDPQIAPDGRRVAFALRGESGPDVWIYDSQRRTASRLTFDGSNRVPVWTADGNRIAYRKGGEGRTGIYWKRADGSGEEESLLDGLANPGSFTPDGKSLILAGLGLGQPYDTADTPGVSFTASDLLVLRLEPPGELETFIESPFAELHPALSPDGRWLAYRSDESGQREVYLRSFPDAGGPWQVSTGGGESPVWSADGRELYFVSAGELTAVRVTVEPGGNPTFGAAERLFEASPDLNAGNPNYDVDRDGRFLMIQRPEREVIVVVLNWLEAARRIAEQSR